MKYDLEYRQQIELADGTKIILRAIQPDDKGALAAGHDKLSDDSRRARFFSAKRQLSEEELRFFTEVDGRKHYALVAIYETADAPPDGVGVARFVCTDDLQTVEIAIVVADAWQHRGVGKRLMRAIVEAAAEREITQIKAITQVENTRLRKLLEPYGGSVRMMEASGGLLEIIIDVPQSPGAEGFDTLYALMRLVALGSLVVPVVIGRASIDLLSELLRLRKRREKD